MTVRPRGGRAESQAQVAGGGLPTQGQGQARARMQTPNRPGEAGAARPAQPHCVPFKQELAASTASPWIPEPSTLLFTSDDKESTGRGS